ncbi:MAG: hypothetical protein Kow0098_15410 [Ignavibacteriaceae bacterium]
MKKLLPPALITALVVFIWSAVSWMVIPWHQNTIHNLPEGGKILELIKKSDLTAGIYHYPGIPEEDTKEALENIIQRYENGPVISFMVYLPDGAKWMDPLQFITGFIIYFICAMICAFFISVSGEYASGFASKVLIVFLLGLFGVLVGPLSEWNWWKFPGDFMIVLVVDMLITWLLAGFVLAWRISKSNLKVRNAG